MRPSFIRSRPYQSSGTHMVSRNLRGYTTRVTSPQTRTSFPIIRLALDSWVTPRRTLASPRLTHLHHHPRLDHPHHHPSSLRRLPLLVLPQILRTRCSHSLSVLTHFGMRPRSSESSLLRIWRHCVLTCRQFWPIRPSSYSSSRLCRPSFLSSWLSTSHHHLCRSDIQGSSLTLYIFFSYQWGHWIFCLGGGGGGGWGGGHILFGDYVFMFCLSLFWFRCFGFSSI